ncbi:GPW/gp25 family protein [Desulforamulus reducens MI-1]|uniref:GPW/gp25 family protein n=1 Tax=Desulforamulus reducens (strain ATCC BAA-1160 / DSM 100696 / MI-1) TaxID=349161 RepID=A4J3V0_DESRM|nr:GPW/gp25 family protein [Desulforamulus reducens]ABO49753.1 GPW/gp25 family protein [Desulforamulus reducens MI-1]
MEVDVTTKFIPLDFGASGTKEILQNVRMILATPKFSCPMDRDFAWDPDVLDAPMNIVQGKIAQRLVEAIRKYEPRAEIVDVSFEGDINGTFKPVVRVRVADDSA